MGKIAVFLSISLGVIGFIRLLLPGIAGNFVSIDAVVAVLCVGVSILTFAYEYTALTKVDLSEVWGFASIALGILFLVFIYTPTLGNLRHYYISMSDMLLIAESATVCGLAYTRRKPNTASLSAYIAMAWMFLLSSLRWKSLNLPSQKPVYRHRNA